MSLTLTHFTDRIGRELKLLATPTNARADLVYDALTELMLSIRDSCRISADLSVSSSTDTYDIPATIDVIEAIEDEEGNKVVYSIDDLEEEITLQDSETSSTAVTYKVYGTPAAVRTNAATIIAALPESYEPALWAFVVASCHGQVETSVVEIKEQRARRKAHELLMYLNSSAGYRDRIIAIRDVTGKIIGDTNASDGVDVGVSDFAETESYDPT